MLWIMHAELEVVAVVRFCVSLVVGTCVCVCVCMCLRVCVCICVSFSNGVINFVFVYSVRVSVCACINNCKYRIVGCVNQINVDYLACSHNLKNNLTTSQIKYYAVYSPLLKHM